MVVVTASWWSSDYQEVGTQDFRKLGVWAAAHQLTLTIYQVTKDLPRSEMYGPSAQTRRAAVSIESNIAEACGRRTRGEFRQFLFTAMGSAKELDCQIQLFRDLGFIEPADHQELADGVTAVQRMLSALIRRLS